MIRKNLPDSPLDEEPVDAALAVELGLLPPEEPDETTDYYLVHGEGTGELWCAGEHVVSLTEEQYRKLLEHLNG